MNYQHQSSIDDDKIVSPLRARGYDIIGIIIDAEKIIAYDGSNTTEPVLFNRCGY
jgi:hypothetical protein